MPSTRAFLQQRHGGGRQRPPGGKLGGERLPLIGRRKTAVPEQPGDVLEGGVFGELRDGNPPMINSPRSPSTWLRRVAAATTPSRPVFTMFET